LLFHVSLTGFSGGFIGVDVFFVISGYLITGNIVRQSAAGTFSFAEFYAGRFRRITPALVVTAGLTSLVSAIIQPDWEMAEVAASAAWSIVGLSNFHFMFDSGYFAAQAITKPLLHTWSLSVEFQ